MAKKHPPKPPTKVEPSVQYDLFSTFIKNTVTLSNTVELWQSIPKYFLTSAQSQKLRNTDGLAPPFRLEYKLRNDEDEAVPFAVKIQPALIEQKSGTHKAFFPSVTEELVEEALKKIFTTQGNGIHVPEKLQSWVQFSYSMIRRELEEAGHKRSYAQIKQALEVMTSCIITVYRDDKEIYRGAILSDYIHVDREQYLTASDSLHIARLPVFISESINTLRYRQFNYDRLMACNAQLSRWLYQKMVSHYIQADYANSYHFAFNTVQQASGLLMQKDNRHNRAKMIEALEELEREQVIREYSIEEKYQGRKISDVVYTVSPHYEFVQEQKVANKRQRDGKNKLQQEGKLKLPIGYTK